MAGRAPRIAIDLEANVAGLISDFRTASTAVSRFSTSATRDLDQTNRAVKSLQSTVESTGRFLKNSFAGIQTVTLLSTITGLSDRYQNLVSKLRLATDNTRQFNVAYTATQQIAKETYTSLESTVALYQRVSNAVKGLGVQQSEVLKIVSTINKAFLVSGATSEEAAASIIQLTQSFGSGYLRGQEFNSIAEQAPRLLQAIADTMHVPRGALKALANDGKITVEVLRKAFTGDAAQQIAKEAEKIPLTFERAFGQLRNSALIYVGELSKSSGFAKSLSASVKYVSENFNQLADATIAVVKIGMVAYLSRLVTAGGQYAKSVYQSIQVETAHAAALQEDARRTLAASAIKTDAALAEQRNAAAIVAAKEQEVKATLSVIAVAREEALAKLQMANVQIAQIERSMEAAKAAGTQSYALRELARAEIELTRVQAVRSASLKELALLGQQSARLSAVGPAASAASAIGTGATFTRYSKAEIDQINASLSTMFSNTAKVGLLTTALGKLGAGLSSLVGGPVGIALIGFYGLYKAFSTYTDAVEQQKQAAADFSASMRKIGEDADYVTKSLGRSGTTVKEAISVYYDAAVKMGEAESKVATIKSQIASLQGSLGRGSNDAGDLATLQVIDKLRDRLATMQPQVEMSKQKFDAMTAALRERLGPGFEQVVEAARHLNGQSLDAFFNNLSDSVKIATAQLDELSGKLDSTVAALPRTIVEMQRKVRDTGLNAADTARNHILDLIEDGKKLGKNADYFNALRDSARGYIQTAAAQEAADKRVAAARKQVSASTREATAANREASQVDQYIDGLKAKTEQLKLEALYGRNASEAEKDLIKFDYMLKDSKYGVYKAREDEIRAILKGNAALEQEARSRQQALDASARELALRRQIADFNESRQQASRREIENLMYGGNTAELNSRQQAVADEYRNMRKQIDQEYQERLNSLPDNTENAALRNQLQKEYIGLIGQTILAESTASAKEKEYLEARIAAQRDWKNGARAAMQDYLAEGQDVAGMTNQMFSNAFHNMEDLVVQFATTGKASFKDFVKSALTDFVRMETRIVLSKIFEWLVNWAIGAFTGTGATTTSTGGTGNFIGPRSANGNVFAGGQVQKFANGGAFTNSVVNKPTMAPMALFGEAGEEAIMPLARDPSGKLGVKAQMAGGSTNVFNTTINTTINSNGSKSGDSSSDKKSDTLNQFSKMMEKKANEAILESLRPGGPLYKEIHA